MHELVLFCVVNRKNSIGLYSIAARFPDKDQSRKILEFKFEVEFSKNEKDARGSATARTRQHFWVEMLKFPVEMLKFPEEYD